MKDAQGIARSIYTYQGKEILQIESLKLERLLQF